MSTVTARLAVLLVAALLGPLARAATVTIVPSTAAPEVGDTFTLTVTADVGNTFAATMALSFDASKVAFVSGVTTGDWTVFTKNSPTTDNPTVFDIEAPAATAANPGTYSAAILTFQAIAGGAAGIVINDDGGFLTGWFDADTAEYIPVTYTQATVGVVANGPAISVTDSVFPDNDRELDFGQVTEGTTSIARTFTITNTGNLDLEVGPVADADALDLPFTLTGDSCSGNTVPPASSCTLSVDFSPAATGDFTDTFDVPSNAPETVVLSVLGTGVGAPAPDVVVTDSIIPGSDLSLPFGSVAVGASSTATLTVTNSGNADLTLGQVATAEPLGAPFSVVTDTCSGQTIAPLGTCTVEVRFEPTAVGAVADNLDIPSDDPDQPSLIIAASGTGAAVPVPDIVVTDDVDPAGDLEVPFGDVPAGTPATRAVTVTNAGTGDLIILTVAGSNPLAAPFSLSTDTCSGRTLPPAGTCSLAIRFVPGAPRGFNDSLNIPSNDPDETTVIVTVNGTGTVPAGSGGSSAVDTSLLLLLAALASRGRRRQGRA